MQECRVRAGHVFQTRLPNIDTKYEGPQADGTHAVSGTATLNGRIQTFKCTFNKNGNKIIQFHADGSAGKPDQPAKP